MRFVATPQRREGYMHTNLLNDNYFVPAQENKYRYNKRESINDMHTYKNINHSMAHL